MIRNFRLAALGAALLSFPCVSLADVDPKPAALSGPVAPESDHRPRVQLAILLDTSSSMDGLIGQTKEQLWKIVNTFNTAKREGKRPLLQIALYEYGKDTLPAEGGYIRQILPFTEDLDRVSEQLFSLKTRGGDEFCGQVIQRATQQLAWSKSKEDLKLIFIAGNEPFTQGPVNYRTAIAAANEHGITVNTIHCGSEAEGIQGGWKDGAMLAHGKFMIIDQNRAVAQVEAPQDKELARLGTELNKTYVGYGAAAPAAQARQEAQDKNAAGLSLGSMTQRAVSKASAHYDNSGWDLVDGAKKGKAKVEALKDDELPAEMRGMTVDQRKGYVGAKAKERETLQKRIVELNEERNKFISTEAKKQAAANGVDSVDSAMIKAMREQAEAKSYSF